MKHMEQAIEYKKKFSTIKKKLPLGSIKIIAERTGVHRDTVSRVLDGKSYRADVLAEALKILREQRSLLVKIEEI